MKKYFASSAFVLMLLINSQAISGGEIVQNSNQADGSDVKASGQSDVQQPISITYTVHSDNVPAVLEGVNANFSDFRFRIAAGEPLANKDVKRKLSAIRSVVLVPGQDSTFYKDNQENPSPVKNAFKLESYNPAKSIIDLLSEEGISIYCTGNYLNKSNNKTGNMLFSSSYFSLNLPADKSKINNIEISVNVKGIKLANLPIMGNENKSEIMPYYTYEITSVKVNGEEIKGGIKAPPVGYSYSVVPLNDGEE